MLFASYSKAGTIGNDPLDTAISATLFRNGTMVFEREGDGDPIIINWELIEFPLDFIYVRHGFIEQADGVGTTIENIPNVGPIDRGFAIGTVSTPFGHGGGRSVTITNSAFDRAMWAINLTSSTTVQVGRDDNNDIGVVGYQVVTFNKVRTLTDSAVAGDSITASPGIVVLTDSVVAGDSISITDGRTLTDSATASDSIALEIRYTLEDSAVAGDSIVQEIRRILTDGVVAGDSIALEIRYTLEDSAVVSDSVFAIYGRTLTDGSVVSDSVLITQVRVLTDNVLVTDGIDRGEVFA